MSENHSVDVRGGFYVRVTGKRLGFVRGGRQGALVARGRHRNSTPYTPSVGKCEQGVNVRWSWFLNSFFPSVFPRRLQTPASYLSRGHACRGSTYTAMKIWYKTVITGSGNFVRVGALLSWQLQLRVDFGSTPIRRQFNAI